MKKYLIVGGVAGGASTATRLRRNDESAQIIIFERGKYISYANCGLPYYIGGVIDDRERLFVKTPEDFERRYNVDVRIRNEVLSIDRESKKVRVKDLSDGKEYEERYDKLILSPGAKALRPPIQGNDQEGVFCLRDVKDTDRIKQFIDTRKPEKVIVIGAGYIGIEMTENLYSICPEVTLIEKADRILPFFDFEFSAALYRHIRSKGVNIYVDEEVASLEKQNGQIAVILNGGERLVCDMVIFSAGVKPDTDWLEESGLEMSSNGSILVNEYLQTSDEDIYAVGDAILNRHKILQEDYNVYLAGPASRQGRSAADNVIYGNNRKYQEVLGTAILKVFDLTAGFVGASGEKLAEHNIEYLTSMIHSASHAGYYPGATPITLKILFSPDEGRIFGAQAIGYQGVDKRLDVISSYIQGDKTVHDLSGFEHSYAPPYSSARDPVSIAGNVGENLIAGRFRGIVWQDLSDERFRDALLLDVRTNEEFECCTIPGSINIHVDELRQRMNELPSGRKIIVFCLQGLRAYLACRILMQNGFDQVYNLIGGYKTYQFVYCRDQKLDIYAEETINKDNQDYPECKCRPCPYIY